MIKLIKYITALCLILACASAVAKTLLLPDRLTGQEMLVSLEDAKMNQQYELQFHNGHSYTYTENKRSYQGQYQYQIIDQINGIAKLTFIEKSTTGIQKYFMVMVAKNKKAGACITKHVYGKRNQYKHMNFATYQFKNPK